MDRAIRLLELALGHSAPLTACQRAGHTRSNPTPNMLLLLAADVRQHIRCHASGRKDEL